MSWETIDGVEAVMTAKIESTSGTDSNPAIGTDDSPWEEFEWDLDVDVRKRRVISPHEPGSRHSIGRVTAKWSAKQTLQLRQITAGDATDAPSIHLAAKIAGFDHQGDVISDRLHTYFLNRKGATTATLRINRAFNGANNFNIAEILGALCDFELSIVAGEPWMFMLTDGFGLAQPAASMFAQGGAALNTAYVHLSENDVRADANVVRVYALESSPVLYGGGSLGTPNQTVDLMSLKVKGNRKLSTQKTVGGAFGVKRVRPDNNESPQATFTLEATGYSDFNPFKYLLNATPLYIGVDGVAPGDTELTARVGLYCQLTNVSEGGNVDGRQSWDCEADLIWPADVSDNDPAAGEYPSQAWGAATGLGLISATGVTAPAGSLMFIQVHDSTAP